MTDSGHILVAGLGSPHGDDQAGWLVAEQLLKKVSGTLESSYTARTAMGCSRIRQNSEPGDDSTRSLTTSATENVVVRRAMIPLDLLDWLENVDVLHICDACETTQRHEQLQRFTWNAGQLVHSDISHAVGIGSFNRVPNGPREGCHRGWSPTRGALPTRLNTCGSVSRSKSTVSDVNAALKLRRGRGSHDFGLPDVLRLAEKTGLLPKQVIVWAIAGNRFQPEDLLSDTTRNTAFLVADEIMNELRLSDA